MATVYNKNYPAPPFDRREIVRYIGMPEELAELEKTVSDCIEKASDKLAYKVCYAEFPIEVYENEVDLGFAKTQSKGLIKELSGCHSIILFAATVGIEIDRMIAKSALASPLLELVLSAIGTERVEALCDEFCRELKVQKAEMGIGVRRRFSPGYSDLPLDLQKDVFRALGCSKHIGLSLNESLLMSPSKSVTAIVGLHDL